METLHLILLLQYIAALHMFTAGSSKECEAPSSPQCFRRNNESTVYDCEWSMKTTHRNVTFDLHFGDIKFESIRETHAQINEEELIKYRRIDIWVEADKGDSVCKSTKTSVVLNETVKFEAPQAISVAWFQNQLNVTWKAAEKYPAFAEVWFRIDETKPWEKRLNTTEFSHSKMAYQLAVENLQKHTSYQVKLRHRTKVTRNPLWSEWSPLVIVPAALEDKLEVNVTLEHLEGARKVTLMWKPVHHHAAAVTGVTYILRDTQSSGGCPCKKTTHLTNRTEYTGYISYSPVNFSVIATNKAGSSPTTIKHVPAEPAPNLKACNKTLLDEKLNKTNCLEWYRLQDGDLRLVARKTKRDMNAFRKSIMDYVGYIHFEHLCINKRPKTVQMCLYYKKENVPKIAPQDFTFNETHSSITLSWNAIPTEDRRGVLTHYNVCSVQLSSDDEHKQECHHVPASVAVYRLENLMPVTKYNITVAGVTSAGEGPKATVTLNTQLINPMTERLTFGLVVAFLFIFLLLVCSCMWKRMKKKILPPLPKPPILEFASQQTMNREGGQRSKKSLPLLKDDEMLEEKEEVVTLQQLHPKDAVETTTQLNIDIERPRVSDGRRDDGLRPSSIQQALRGSKGEEMPDQEEQMLALLLYRNRLVFDMNTN